MRVMRESLEKDIVQIVHSILNLNDRDRELVRIISAAIGQRFEDCRNSDEVDYCEDIISDAIHVLEEVSSVCWSMVGEFRGNPEMDTLKIVDAMKNLSAKDTELVMTISAIMGQNFSNSISTNLQECYEEMLAESLDTLAEVSSVCWEMAATFRKHSEASIVSN